MPLFTVSSQVYTFLSYCSLIVLLSLWFLEWFHAAERLISDRRSSSSEWVWLAGPRYVCCLAVVQFNSAFILQFSVFHFVKLPCPVVNAGASVLRYMIRHAYSSSSRICIRSIHIKAAVGGLRVLHHAGFSHINFLSEFVLLDSSMHCDPIPLEALCSMLYGDKLCSYSGDDDVHPRTALNHDPCS
jgi:hypothetical protein